MNASEIFYNVKSFDFVELDENLIFFNEIIIVIVVMELMSFFLLCHLQH